jgi:NAD(P)-dependent dehydrogenase (short-subunit alcohol dehydrogenase family)
VTLRHLEGRSAVVTGGGRGIGLGITQALAAAGASVLVVQRSEPAADTPGQWLRADLQDDKDLVRLARDLVSREVDVLVNNAGTNWAMSLLDWHQERWERMLALNVRAPLHLASELAGGMCARRWGRIVNVCSIASDDHTPLNMAYGSMKAMLQHMTGSWAVECAGRGVLVNAVAPGIVETNMTARLSKQAKLANRSFLGVYEDLFRTRVPLERAVTPKDVGAAVAFLTSPSADAIVGQCLRVCGGQFPH